MAPLALTSLLAALLPVASAATFNINNMCDVPVHVYRSHCGRCNQGLSGVCDYDGGAPWTIPAGQGGGSILRLDYITDGCGASIKISKNDQTFRSGILQFEHNYVPSGTYAGIYWDLSDLDGVGPGLTGTPFFKDHVKVVVSGNAAGSGTCTNIFCRAGEACLDSYQHPDDPNTKFCPLDTGDMWLDLCIPNSQVKRDAPEIEAMNNSTLDVTNSTTAPVVDTSPAPVEIKKDNVGVRRNHALNIPEPYRVNEKVNPSNEEVFAKKPVELKV